MSVIPPFLPDGEAAGSDAGPPRNDPRDLPYFLFVGRLEAIKGVQDVVPLFRDRGTTELWIAGAGTYETRLRELVGGSRRVRFLGRQKPEDLRSLYRGALAVVLPSICYEVFPMVVLEAFREATPIVARNLGPFPEIVAQSGGGLLFHTSEELKNALTRLQADPELRDRLGDAAARAFNANWTEAVAMKGYFELVYRLARGRRMTRILDKIPGPYRDAEPGGDEALADSRG